jgi:hypothetical protein
MMLDVRPSLRVADGPDRRLAAKKELRFLGPYSQLIKMDYQLT